MMNKSLIRRIGTVLISAGADPRRMLSAMRAIPHYISSMLILKQEIKKSGENVLLRLVPTLSDLYEKSGVAKGHYFHQDLWAAREVRISNPRQHFDVGSRIDGFVAHLLCFREVDVFDIRPLISKVEGLRFHQADMMSEQPQSLGQAESVSCLHALEHFGLGRYGDPVSFNGWKQGLANLAAMVKDKGYLYLSLPVGKAAIEFNAQRIFNAAIVAEQGKSLGLNLVMLNVVDDHGDFHSDVSLDFVNDMDFACGCFKFMKID